MHFTPFYLPLVLHSLLHSNFLHPRHKPKFKCVPKFCAQIQRPLIARHELSIFWCGLSQDNSNYNELESTLPWYFFDIHKADMELTQNLQKIWQKCGFWKPIEAWLWISVPDWIPIYVIVLVPTSCQCHIQQGAAQIFEHYLKLVPDDISPELLTTLDYWQVLWWE